MTEEEWGDCFVEASRLKLSGWELLEDMELCMEVCNGLGAEWMPDWIRKFLGWLLPVFAPAVAIHDLRYEIGEGPREKWDDEFEENCRKLASDKYAVFNPLRLQSAVCLHMEEMNHEHIRASVYCSHDFWRVLDVMSEINKN